MKRIISSLVSRHWLAAGLLIFSIIISPHISLAQWPGDPSVNVALSSAVQDQRRPAIVSDSHGGAIVAWYDYRSNTTYDIYAQSVDSLGAVKWTANGVAVSAASGDQFDPTIVSDGAGGAIIAWRDNRGASSDIYAQRIDVSGVARWTVNGVPISTAAESQWHQAMVSDGAGGAIIAWYDYRSVPNTHIYAQRVNASGAVQWTANGIPISTAANNQYDPVLIGDGVGGAFIVWRDSRNGNMDIYAQRVNASGAVQWVVDGVPVTTAAGGQYDPALVSDGAGGAIITWRDTRNGSDDIYAQRINPSGAVRWTADGVAVSTAIDYQTYPAIVGFGSGGAIITWEDSRSGNGDIYAQRVDSSGVMQWTADGVPVTTAVDSQDLPVIVSDGIGSAIIAWADYRNGATHDIYAQRINAMGDVMWTANGVAISTAASSQVMPVMVSDGRTGAIIAWEDLRSGTNYDIYAQDVCAIAGATSPVTSLDFDGEYLEDGAVVSWSAHYVENVAAFRLYARRIGESAWNFIAEIEKDGTEYQYCDTWAGEESVVEYRLSVVDLNGEESVAGALSVSRKDASGFALFQNRPNPFGRSTVIRYALPTRQRVSLKVFNVLGQEVAALVDGVEGAGVKSVTFDAGDLPSGIYFCRMQTPGYSAGQKLIMVR